MKKKRPEEWFDKSEFWRETYPFVFSEARFAEAGGEMEKLITLAKPSGRKVLDLCCGPGRSSVALARQGYEVTGVDVTGFLLEKARELSERTGTEIEWVQMDMRDFVWPQSFDLIINFYTSFGYFEKIDEDLGVLKNIRRSLKRGGVFVIDIISKEILAKTRQPTMSTVLPDGSKLIQRNEVIDEWTRMRNEWIVIRDGIARSYYFQHTIYSGRELRDILKRAGFNDVRLFGSLDGEEYGPDAQRLIAVAT